jgi:hypothetical protein
MTNVEIKKLIVRGERSREQGQTDLAGSLLAQAFEVSVEQENAKLTCSALGHLLVVFQHRYEESGEKTDLDDLQTGAETGLELVRGHGLPLEFAHPFYFRLGQAQILRNQPRQAVANFQKALISISGKKSLASAETKARLELAKVLAKKVKTTAGFNQALILAQQCRVPKARKFHRLVVMAGIYIHQAEAEAFLDHKLQVRRALNHAEIIAEELVSEHHMPMRLEQIEGLKQKLQL